MGRCFNPGGDRSGLLNLAAPNTGSTKDEDILPGMPHRRKKEIKAGGRWATFTAESRGISMDSSNVSLQDQGSMYSHARS